MQLPQTVLIVDDDPTLLAALKTLIGMMPGVRTVCASTGEQAVRFAIAQNPVLILMDVRLPDFDGYEATRRILAEGRGARPAVWFISGRRDQIDQEQLENVGANGFLFKPFGAGSVRGIVREALGDSEDEDDANAA